MKNMSMILYGILMLVNLGISFWNARIAGMSWEESKAVGGWVRTSVWAGAVMAAVGFTSVYGFIVLLVGVGAGWLPAGTAAVASSLLYLMMIIPCLGSGLIIMGESWVCLARERSLANIGVAAWNTLAMAHNAWSAYNSLGKAWESVTKSASDALGMNDGDIDTDSDFIKAVIAVAIAVFGGVLTTVVIMRRYMGTVTLPARN